MKLVNTNNENSFDPTPKLKSSPIPILFVSFNEYDKNCIYCRNKYTETPFSSRAKVLQNCLSHYLANITDKCLNVYYIMDIEFSEHETSRTKEPQNIQEYRKIL